MWLYTSCKPHKNEQMIGQMAIAIAFQGFNDLGHTVTPVFLSMDHFLYRFSALIEKNEENLSTRSLTFLQSARSSSVLFCSSFIGATFSNAF